MRGRGGSASLAPVTAPPATTHHDPLGQAHGWAGSAFKASIYDPFLALGEHRGMRWERAALLRHAHGRVAEVGAGTGLNAPLYPDGVEQLQLFEPNVAMSRRLRHRVRRSGRAADVVCAPAERLPLESGSVDTVVSTLVLCTVDDPEQVLAEIARVLCPQGRFLFIEHVRASSPRLARWQDRLERPWRSFAEGCRCNRPTLEQIEQAGFRVEHLTRGSWRAMPAIVRPLVTGRASAPA